MCAPQTSHGCWADEKDTGRVEVNDRYGGKTVDAARPVRPELVPIAGSRAPRPGHPDSIVATDTVVVRGRRP